VGYGERGDPRAARERGEYGRRPGDGAPPGEFRLCRGPLARGEGAVLYWPGTAGVRSRDRKRPVYGTVTRVEMTPAENFASRSKVKNRCGRSYPQG
jgi:hypothetical protein